MKRATQAVLGNAHYKWIFQQIPDTERPASGAYARISDGRWWDGGWRLRKAKPS